MIKVQDRGNKNWTYYQTEGWGMTIDFENDPYNSCGYFKEGKLRNNNKEHTFSNVEDLIDFFKYLKQSYPLVTRNVHSKDVLVIYTDNLRKAKGFLGPWITTVFSNLYFQVLDNIEIRPCWIKEIKEEPVNLEYIANWAQKMIDEVFIPDRYFYITPNQTVRRRMKKACKDDIAKDIFPDSYEEYNWIREALFGGACYCPYPGMVVDEPMIAIDLKSAYIYCLCIKKHCMSASREVDTDTWDFYLDSQNKGSIGEYEITYTATKKSIRCYKNKDGERLQIGENVTDTMVFTNIDLKIFLDNFTVSKIECTDLVEYDMDYLPKYMVDSLIKEFMLKEELKASFDEELARIQKIIVNGEYGETIRKLKSRTEWKNALDNTVVAPQWGIFCTSYCKKQLLSLALQLAGWIYSDTDSIYCLDTKRNRELIEEFNNTVREEIKEWCDKFGYDYEKLKNMGCFMVEHEIKKFRAVKQKQYVFTTVNDKMYVKAAGCNKERIKKNDDLYDAPTLSSGIVIKHVEDDYYWEEPLGAAAAEIMVPLYTAINTET